MKIIVSIVLVFLYTSKLFAEEDVKSKRDISGKGLLCSLKTGDTPYKIAITFFENTADVYILVQDSRTASLSIQKNEYTEVFTNSYRIDINSNKKKFKRLYEINRKNLEINDYTFVPAKGICEVFTSYEAKKKFDKYYEEQLIEHEKEFEGNKI